MNNFIIAGFLGNIAGAGALIGALWIGVVVFYVVLPILIWLDMRRLCRITLEESEEREKANQATLQELKRQNELTRQLLRAYGHDPEA